ncbi:MAG: Hpt domain-containing protein [Woeseia sp.]|nr:Hpt domain-containing protein [Woeseia sp.]MBT8097587.1 Hpt domain-containing protein [Woeseia sp.]NNE61420.1 Hpt domain-containing protein [Woeseia sp.]NNL53902.1 Hpt domain-containing protein [Woeseia sp.]
MITVDIADPFARKLMARYLSHRQEDIRNLRDAVAAADFEAVRLSGHNMHGSGSAYGLDWISELGKALETAAIDHDPDEASRLITALESYVRALHIA